MISFLRQWGGDARLGETKWQFVCFEGVNISRFAILLNAQKRKNTKNSRNALGFFPGNARIQVSLIACGLYSPPETDESLREGRVNWICRFGKDGQASRIC